MKEPAWVLREVVLLAHEQSLAQFGGSIGIRDEGLLDSALGKPQNRFAYGKANLFELAASYAFGIVKNHPFIDGNKRAAFLAAADDCAARKDGAASEAATHSVRALDETQRRFI